MGNMEEFGQAAFNTLPRSMREQNIITAVKENLDPEELERNQTLTKTKTPAELAQIHSLAEFPVPDKIKHLFEKSKQEINAKKETKKRRHSDSEPEVPENFSLYATLPTRQQLVETKSPIELSAITSLSDIPVPSKITKIMNKKSTTAISAPGSKLDLTNRS